MIRCNVITKQNKLMHKYPLTPEYVLLLTKRMTNTL